MNRKQLAQSALIELSPDVALRLEADLGASESTLELGGITLTDLELSTGASRTEVRFSRPTRGVCRTARLTTGAAELIVKGAGNAGCRRWEIEGGVGALTLDLSGAWPEDAQAAVSMTLGAVRIRAPSDLGVRLTLSRFLAGFDARGFLKRGRSYLSRNYDGAARHLDLEVSTTMGDINVEWVEPSPNR